MFKLIVVLLIGLAVGYSYGFKDAKTHDRTIFARSLDNVGGKSREHMKSDVDRQMDSLEATPHPDTGR